MINPKKIISLFKINKTDFFTGVPDSVLKELTILLEKKVKKITSSQLTKVQLFR